MLNQAEIGKMFLTVLQKLKEADKNEIDWQGVREAVAQAIDYLAEGIPGKEHSWQKTLKQTYQELNPDGSLFALISNLDYLVGLYEIVVWGVGQMGCPGCGQEVPAFDRVIDGDEGILCNRCFHKP